MKNSAIVVDDVAAHGDLFGMATTTTDTVRAELAAPGPMSGSPLVQRTVERILVRRPQDQDACVRFGKKFEE